VALIDVGLCGLFFLGGLAIITVDRGHKGLPHHFAWLLVTLCLARSIALRRLYPMPVLLIVTAALAASTMLGQGSSVLPMVALPLYSVVVRFDRRTSRLRSQASKLLLLASARGRGSPGGRSVQCFLQCRGGWRHVDSGR